MIHKILTLFVHTLKVDEKHDLLTGDKLTQRIEMLLSQKQKTFFEFFLAFLKYILNFQFLQKKMALVADVFLEIQAPKNMVR